MSCKVWLRTGLCRAAIRITVSQGLTLHLAARVLIRLGIGLISGSRKRSLWRP